MKSFRFCFLSIAILSRSSQTRFACRDVLLPLNFLDSFSFFQWIFFVCLSKKFKEALLISGIVPNGFSWFQSLKK